ncbi:DUF4118 domain-containing protein [bacterium]|nr:DUF4118 domain-containing protein [bacterium]
MGLFVNTFMGYYTVALVFLTSIIVLSLMVSRGAIMLAALLSAVLWDVLFIPPRYHFTIGKTEDVLMLGMYVLTAVVVGTLTGRARQNELLNRQHEDQLSSLLKLSRRLVSARTIDDISSIAMAHLRESFKTRVCIYLSSKDGELSSQPHRVSDFIPGEKELGVASWAFKNRKAAGKFTVTLSGINIRFIPLATERGSYGIIGIDLATQRTFTFEEETLVNGAVQQIIAAVERVRLIDM